MITQFVVINGTSKRRASLRREGPDLPLPAHRSVEMAAWG